MNRPMKIIFALAAAFVAILAVAMVMVALFVNPNDYKDDISKIVQEKTGRQLTFQGDISLSVFPWIGVTTKGITISNAEGFGNEPMLKLGSADVSLRLLPLLSGSIALGNIEVDGLQVNLMRNSKGVTNLDDLTGAAAKSSQEAGTKNVSESTGSESSADPKGMGNIDLSIGGLEVKDANITYDDRENNVKQSIEDCDITLGAVRPGSPFDFKLHVKLSSTAPEVTADTDLSGRASFDLARSIYNVDDLKVLITAVGKALPGGSAQLEADATASVDMESGKADLNKMVISAYGAKAIGSLSATGLKSGNISFESNLNVPSFNLAETLSAMNIPYKAADAKALTNVGVSVEASGSTTAIDIKNLQVNIDDTTLKGNLSLKNPERPDIRYVFNLDKINLDRYMPEAGTGTSSEAGNESASEKSAQADASAGSNSGLLPVELLRKLTLDGNFNAGEVVMSGAKLENIVVKAVCSNGVFSIKPASLNVAGGSFVSTANVNVKGSNPVMDAAAKLSGLDGGELSKQINGEEKFAGKIGFDAELNTSGNDMKNIFANLNGKLGFNASDGYVSGMDILFMASNAFSTLTGKSMNSEGNDKTEFGEASASATITNGVAVNKDLIVKSPLLRAEGDGLVNLKTMTLDYRLDAKIVSTLEGQGGKNQKDLVGLTVPLNITGSLADPSVMVDLPRFAKAVAEGGFGIVSDVLKGVGGIVEGLGNTLTGKKSSTSGDSGSASSEKPEPEKVIKDLGNAVKGLFK